MEDGGGDLEFVNREAELAFLERCFAEAAPSPALVLIRAPTGFGKTRLVDRFRADWRGTPRICVVDPSVRAALGGAALYEGYFLQRCAEALTEAARKGAPWPTFDQFLRNRRWRTAADKALLEVAGELPTVASAYKAAFDYAARLLGFGHFSARYLLQSDQAQAVALCAEYAAGLLRSRNVVLVVREAQHTDLSSLRQLLLAQEDSESPDLLFEYTTETGGLHPAHQKAFLEAASKRGAISILDMAKLDLAHVQLLLRQNVDSNFLLNTESHLAWNGNLRTIEELKFRVGVGRIRAAPTEIVGLLEDLTAGLTAHLNALGSLERLVLAALYAHVEPLDESLLARALSRVDGPLQPTRLADAVEELIIRHRFVVRAESRLRLHDETVATTLSDSPQFRPFLAMAEKGLRDMYAEVVATADYRQVGVPLATRQLFRLCVRTRDVAGLKSATDKFLADIKRAQDQSVYIDAVAMAIEANPELFADDHDELISWAAALAYDASDWTRVISLGRLRRSPTVTSQAMLAFAFQETGRHDEAIDVAQRIRNSATREEHLLVADLIHAVTIGCRGDHAGSRALLDAVTTAPEHKSNPLLGYAFRLYDVVDSSLLVLPKLQKSIQWFGRHGFHKSKAYSQLPAAIYLARLGDGAAARRMLNAAQRALSNEVRDQHILLNNRAAVELLTVECDFGVCKDLLAAALSQARDDYSELTILTNLALANWGAGEMDIALELVRRAQGILEEHDFEDQDIYWPACFNAAQIFDAAGDSEAARRALAFPAEHGRPVSVNQSYWAYRYGQTEAVEPPYSYLATRPMHPLYLSRWLIDLEGLDWLSAIPPR